MSTCLLSVCSSQVLIFLLPRRTIDRGESVKWKMMIQVMEPEQVETLEFDPFDVTGISIFSLHIE